MSQLQSIFNIAELCFKHGVEHAIVSPGSRCAPITLAFVRHTGITTKTISDERSAAFIALGIAQYSQKPTVLVCTSGSAAYNYAPAVAEAYYQHIPLIVITADRPPEWIDQYDGQTINQDRIFGKHVKASYSLPIDLSNKDGKWHFNRLLNEAIITAKKESYGPVHLNIPLREPFYPSEDESIINSDDLSFFQEVKSITTLEGNIKKDLNNKWKKYKNRLIVVGQSNSIPATIIEVANKLKIPIVADIISNAHAHEKVIRYADLILGESNKEVTSFLKPDLLITFGKSTISKNLKLFLRKNQVYEHWHIQAAGNIADTYQSLTTVVSTSPEDFFLTVPSIEEDKFEFQKQENYFNIWDIEERKVIRHIQQNSTYKEFNELSAYKMVMDMLPSNCSLHLANSLAVRYANYIGLQPAQDDITVYANRGTSGIDGSNSTAVGSAIASGKKTVLLTGDMAFFYDRNAFWHNYDISNLKIVVFNNHGGGIFNMIKGPSEQPEYKEYFETNQKLTAKFLAQEFGYEYIHCDRTRKLKNSIKALFECEGTAILEIETDSEVNKEVLFQFKNIKNT